MYCGLWVCFEITFEMLLFVRKAQVQRMYLSIYDIEALQDFYCLALSKLKKKTKIRKNCPQSSKQSLPIKNIVNQLLL